MRTMKHLAFVAMAASALALAGCGGGGSGGSSPVAAGAGAGAGTTTTPDGTALSYSDLQTGTTTLMAGTTYHVTGAPSAFTNAVDAINPPTGGYEPGETVTLGDLVVGCSGAVNCDVTPNADGSFTITGTIVVGANVATVTAALDLPDPPPSALSFATDLNGSVEALETLSGDADAEGSALMMASENAAKIGTEGSDGNSMAAMMSAQAVLNARKMLADAIEDANEDLTEAKEAKSNTEDEDVIAALDRAISTAEDEIEAAKKILDGDDLAGHVEMVTGDDEDDVKTAADKGEEVAMAVAMALGPTSNTDGAGLRVNFGNAVPTAAPTGTRDTTVGTENPVAKANKFATDNHMGMTWAMVAGEDNVMMKRLGNNNAEVPAASIAGMVAADSIDSLDVNNLPGGAGAPGDYMGIPGTVYCLGDDCEVGAAGTANAGKLVGSWYFSPTSPMAYYEKAAGATDYTQEEYVQYGHWLVVDDGSVTTANAGQVTVMTYAALNGTTTDSGTWAAADPTSDNAGLKASSATYSGMAAGRSVHKTLDSQGAVTDIQSGRFMADVMLRATFADAGSTLGGMIDNFRGVDNEYAVDSSWEVTLNAVTTADGTVTNDGSATDGVTEATGQNGDWTADAYGAAAARPVGIFGNFNAHFTDGHAAGAYATRKD